MKLAVRESTIILFIANLLPPKLFKSCMYVGCEVAFGYLQLFLDYSAVTANISNHISNVPLCLKDRLIPLYLVVLILFWCVW